MNGIRRKEYRTAQKAAMRRDEKKLFVFFLGAFVFIGPLNGLYPFHLPSFGWVRMGRLAGRGVY